MTSGKKPISSIIVRKVAMTKNTFNPSHPNESTSVETTLESWKEIATYLGRDVSTLRRWEKYEHLPVRRHRHLSRSSVYAYPSELEAWKTAREPGFDSAPPVPRWRRPALGLTLAMLLALVSFGSGPLLTPPNALAQDSGGMTARRVWAGSRPSALSSDGRYFTYVDWSTGNLALRDLVTGEARPLTHKSSPQESLEFAGSSVFSPDDRQVVYTWYSNQSRELRLIGLDGSDPRVLYSNEEVEYLQPAAWSPDGEHVLATFSRRDRTNQIGLVAVADGSVRVLKTLDWRGPSKMSFSPDGRTIAYAFQPQEDSPNRDIFLLATDGSRETTLIEHPANDRFPVWTPDGEKVVFASDRTGSMSLWAIRVRDGRPQGVAELVKRDTGRILPLIFTPEGSFYYGRSTSMQDVYIASLDLATGKLFEAPTRPIQRFVGANGWPDWSPDGRYLAYSSVRKTMVTGDGFGSRVIVIRSVETGEERELSPGLFWPHLRPRWSPDGSFLLVGATDAKGREGLYRVDPQTGEAEPLGQSEDGDYSDVSVLSPDGKSLFIKHKQRVEGPKTYHYRLLRRNLETGRETELYPDLPPTGLSNSLALSPDGRQLAFALFDWPARSVVLQVVPVGSGEPHELLRMKDPEKIPWSNALAWSPDGKELLFVKCNSDCVNEKRELWGIPARGGEPRRLELAMEGLAGLRFHPDGKQIAFTAGSHSAELWVMENFLPKASTESARLEQ